MDSHLDASRSTPRAAIARLVAAMMVADRRLATAEIDEASRLDHIGLGPLSPIVRDELQRATRMPIDVGDACTALAGTGPALIGTVLSVLADLAASDGAVDDDERRMFATIANRLGARRAEIEDYLESDEPSGDVETTAPGGAPLRSAVRGDDRADTLRALGLGSTASPAEVDAAYLRLVEQYDPAKVAPLGADFVVLAVRKLAALSDLYEVARHAAKG
jgi:DnaJ-domain-containing protein 1